jgi:glutathione S-transferase
MILFTNLTSPYSRLVRVAIAEKGLSGTVEERVIDPWGGDPEFLRANVHERVPALITDSGHGIAESGLILALLDRIAPEPALYPQAGLPEVLQRASSALGAIDVMAAIGSVAQIG